MVDIKRISPVSFGKYPKRTEIRDNWTIAMEYDGEGQGLSIVDLSHITRLDVQTKDLSAATPFGVAIPEVPGHSVLEGGVLINRMNGTQASVFQLPGNDADCPSDVFVTETTENTLCVAIMGKDVFSFMEKVTNLDFLDPQMTAPFLFQGPCCHVPCQIITLCKDGEKAGLILTCSRGYGKDMIHSLMDSGVEFNMQPAGEEKFSAWVASL